MWWMLALPWWNAYRDAFAPFSVAPVAQAPPSNNDAPPTHPLAPYFQTLATHGDHAFGVWEKGTGFALFSANWERITGLPTGQCAGKAFMQLIAQRDAEILGGALQSLPTRLDQPLVIEANAKDDSKSDGIRSLGFALWPMSEAGLHNTVMVMAKDIDALRRMQQQFNSADAERNAAEKSRSNFLSNMSHELRTPLNAIMGFSEMMQTKMFGDVGHPTYEEYVNDIHHSGRHLLGKINDLLDIASIDQNQLSLDEDEIDVQGLIGDVLEAFSHTAFERNIKIERDLPKDAVIAVADRPKILCILSHFISNAIRHSGPDSAITVACRVHRTQGLIVSVRDQGEGISAARLANIVKALQSGETYFAMDSEGIGLGLSLSKELAARHDGAISIDSIRHKGTVVSLVLPPERVIKGLGTGNGRRSIHLAKH